MTLHVSFYHMTWFQSSKASNISSSFVHFSNLMETMFPSVFEFIELCILFVGSAGNIMLIVVCIRIRKLEKNINCYILNLSVCDLLLILSSIPTSLLAERSISYPFGAFGCKFIDPLATYAMNAGVFTLVAIAMERYQAVAKPMHTMIKESKVWPTILGIHTFAFLLVVPYMMAKSHTTKRGKHLCVEDNWNKTGKQIYTLILSFAQYFLPAPIMILTYIKAWISVKRVNDRFIRDTLLLHAFNIFSLIHGTSQEATGTKRGMLLPRSDNADRRDSVLESSKQILLSGRKMELNHDCIGSYRQKVIRGRITQTRRLLKMFSGVVIVFVIFVATRSNAVDTQGLQFHDDKWSV